MPQAHSAAWHRLGPCWTVTFTAPLLCRVVVALLCEAAASPAAAARRHSSSERAASFPSRFSCSLCRSNRPSRFYWRSCGPPPQNSLCHDRASRKPKEGSVKEGGSSFAVVFFVQHTTHCSSRQTAKERRDRVSHCKSTAVGYRAGALYSLFQLIVLSLISRTARRFLRAAHCTRDQLQIGVQMTAARLQNLRLVNSAS